MSSYSQHKRIWHDVPQNSDEWFAMRMGKVTASNLDDICANMGKAFGDPAIKYARKKALERITGQLDERSDFKSATMEQGQELEAPARQRYEEETFNAVGNGGFTEWGLLGDSTDGMVGEDGCIEVKCVIANTHWTRIQNGAYNTAYKWQIQGHLWISDKKWCDFVQFCPEFPTHKQLYVYRVERDEQMIEQIQARVELFEQTITELMNLLS